MRTYQFQIMCGLPGCMPNYVSGPFEAATRKELASILRSEIEALSFPKSAFDQFGIRHKWRHIARHGGSSVHGLLTAHGTAEQIEIVGLTEAEFIAAEKESCQ